MKDIISIDFNNLKKGPGGDFNPQTEWYDLITENDGSFEAKDEYIVFDCDGNEIVVEYDLMVEGKTFYDKGDQFTPPYADFDVTSEIIKIKNVLINDIELDLTDDIRKIFEKKISESI